MTNAAPFVLAGILGFCALVVVARAVVKSLRHRPSDRKDDVVRSADRRTPRLRLYLRAVFGRSPKDSWENPRSPQAKTEALRPAVPRHLEVDPGSRRNSPPFLDADQRLPERPPPSAGGRGRLAYGATTAVPMDGLVGARLEVTSPSDAGEPRTDSGRMELRAPSTFQPESSEDHDARLVDYRFRLAEVGPERDEVVLVAEDSPIVFGADPASTVVVPGEGQQAAIVHSDGAALVSRLGQGQVRLGQHNVEAVGLPITAANYLLRLGHVEVDLSGFIVKAPNLGATVTWSLANTSASVVQGSGHHVLGVGSTAIDAIRIASGCFAGVGRRAAGWAVEAVAERQPEVGVLLVGATSIDGAPRLVLAARELVIDVELLSSGELLELAGDPSRLVTAEVSPDAGGVRVRVGTLDGIQVASCMIGGPRIETASRVVDLNRHDGPPAR